MIDASDLSSSDQKPRVDRHDVGDCTLKLNRAIAFDQADEIAVTSRFVVVDDYEIQGGGIVREALPDKQAWIREKVLLRNYKWEPSFIATDRRAARFAQRPTLRARGFRVEQLDGDTIRHLFPNTGFTRPERDAHIKRVGYLASKLEQNGVFVVASFVSPYEESRQFVRGLCGNFVEIYVDTPLAVCEQRDAKGLYAKARRGEIENFTGIDDPYESPTQPELVLDTTTLTVEQAGARVLDLVSRRIGKAD